MQCPSCNNDLPESAEFCDLCGCKLTEQYTICPDPACGKNDIPEEANFCPDCGAELHHSHHTSGEATSAHATSKGISIITVPSRIDTPRTSTSLWKGVALAVMIVVGAAGLFWYDNAQRDERRRNEARQEEMRQQQEARRNEEKQQQEAREKEERQQQEARAREERRQQEARQKEERRQQARLEREEQARNERELREKRQREREQREEERRKEARRTERRQEQASQEEDEITGSYIGISSNGQVVTIRVRALRDGLMVNAFGTSVMALKVKPGMYVTPVGDSIICKNGEISMIAKNQYGPDVYYMFTKKGSR